jgi:hypothetical protein
MQSFYINPEIFNFATISNQFLGAGQTASTTTIVLKTTATSSMLIKMRKSASAFTTASKAEDMRDELDYNSKSQSEKEVYIK